MDIKKILLDKLMFMVTQHNWCGLQTSSFILFYHPFCPDCQGLGRCWKMQNGFIKKVGLFIVGLNTKMLSFNQTWLASFICTMTFFGLISVSAVLNLSSFSRIVLLCRVIIEWADFLGTLRTVLSTPSKSCFSAALHLWRQASRALWGEWIWLRTKESELLWISKD